MDRRRAFTAVSAALVVVLLFVLLRGGGGQPGAPGSQPVPARSTKGGAAVRMPPAYLAWMPGGFPDGFAAKIPSLAGVARAVVVAGDTRWLTRSISSSGTVVDDPTPPYAIPIDAFAVDPEAYAPFVSSAYRGLLVRTLQRGEAVLGATSAHLRRIGPGGRLSFGAHTVTVGAVVPDPVVGWSEMLVSRSAGAPLGIVERPLPLGADDGRSQRCLVPRAHPALRHARRPGTGGRSRGGQLRARVIGLDATRGPQEGLR